MVASKKYYWIKLKDSFMTSDTVDFLMSQKGGANYVVLYQMLCLKTINTGGVLGRQLGEVIIPYDAHKIQRDCKWFDIDTVLVALELYTKLGLVYEMEDGLFCLVGLDKLIGCETEGAVQKRLQRANKQKALLASEEADNAQNDVQVASGQCLDNVLDLSGNCTQFCPPRYRDRYRDRDRDRDNNNESSCAELSDDSSTPKPEKANEKPVIPSVFSLPLNNGTFYEVTQKEIDEYAVIYPAVDITQQYRNMIGWLNADTKRRKTRTGIKRFINGWLAREQNSSWGGKRQGQQSNTRPKPYDAYIPVPDMIPDDDSNPFKR